MTDLKQARREIDRIDKEFAQLFQQRMKAVRKVVEYKISENLPVFDSGREQEIIETGLRLIEDVAIRPYYKQFLIYQMEVSKKYQQDIVEGQM